MRILALLAVLQIANLSVAADTLRVASFNLRGDFDGGAATDKPDGWLRKSGVHRRDLALRMARELDADVLGVQEAYANQLHELDAELDGHAYYGVGREDGASEGEHSAIYYRLERFQRVDSGTFWLSHTPEEPSFFPGAACRRIASWVVLRDFRADGAELLVVNTHWDHVSGEARRHSGELIAQRLPKLAEGRGVVVMGDLNATEQSEAVATLVGGELKLVDSHRVAQPERGENERTFHNFQGGEQGSRIDFVFHNGRLRTVDARIVRTAYEGAYPSDHYPVVAELAWR